METIPIRGKYELELMPITIGGKRLELYGIRNWDIFVNNLVHRGEAYISEFPFWVKIWEASIVLADHLIQIGFEKEKEILEIGAGMGITGLFLGALGYKVTITDYEEDALELLQMNAEHNGLDNVSIKKMDWSNPDLTGKYDIICGSELIYKEASIKPIIDLSRKYLQPEGTVFIAHDSRRKCMVKFIGMVPGRFEIENIEKTLRGEDEFHRIVIHTLRLKE
ncbi:MAG: methyltransferase domain-containing protein [Desulfobacterales bacterium]|nr:methyltransferase domain-containing protein [Desulfobacterales bacterium]